MSRKRMALLGALAVVLVSGIAFLALSDNFPPKSELTGAIGGVQKAERYRDAQVTASDVAVDSSTETTVDGEGFDHDVNSPGSIGHADANKPGSIGHADANKPGVVGIANANKPGSIGNASANKPGSIGNASANKPGVVASQGHAADQ